MSISAIIIGESGTGKSTSFRNFDKSECLLIQTLKKPLPFKNNWTPVGTEGGNIVVTDSPEQMMKVMEGTKKKVIIIDDFQYMIAHEFLKRSAEIGFTKFTEMALHCHQVMVKAGQLEDDDKRVYFLSHSETNEDGRTKFKTIGKLLDEKIVVEGMVSIVLKTFVEEGNFFFSTKNSGSDTVKTPMDMFEESRIPNDLKLVDQSICSYWNINQSTIKQEA